MAGFADFTENNIMDGLYRTAAFVKPAQITQALLKTLPTTDAGAGLAKMDYTGAVSDDQGAPVDADWKDPSTGQQGEVNNLNELTFGQNTGSTQRAIGIAQWTETAETNLLMFAPLADNWRGTTIDLTGDELTAEAHGLSNDDRVFLRDLLGATGLLDSVEYHVISAATDTFQVSLTQGGAAVTVTVDGSGQVGDSQAKDVGANDTPKIAIAGLKIQLG